MSTIRFGTSGFSYKEWRPGFYPADLPDREFLRYYASRFNTVEIDSTFYRMPNVRTIDGWKNATGEDFRITLKASQQITHRKRLKDAADPVAYFFKIAVTLGDRMGPVLFQLPPNLKKDLPRLSDFLTVLPPASRCAVEFRHESWFEDDVYEALRGRGCALCVAEDEELATPWVPTAGWGYLRLRRQDYGEEDLRDRAGKLQGQPWSEAYVFFKHEEGGKGPKLAGELTRILSSA